jgi:hypothetical protein
MDNDLLRLIAYKLNFDKLYLLVSHKKEFFCDVDEDLFFRNYLLNYFKIEFDSFIKNRKYFKKDITPLGLCVFLFNVKKYDKENFNNFLDNYLCIVDSSDDFIPLNIVNRLHVYIAHITSYDLLLQFEKVIKINWIIISSLSYEDDQYIGGLLRDEKKTEDTVKIFQHYVENVLSNENIIKKGNLDLFDELKIIAKYIDNDILDIIDKFLDVETVVMLLLNNGETIDEDAFDEIINDEKRSLLSDWIMENRDSSFIEELKEEFNREYIDAYDIYHEDFEGELFDDYYQETEQFQLIKEKYKFL